ncbi:hypothetical protein QL996_04575 [Planococcus sp. APC 4015]|nr:hypothetical protein [Planococcus sp. APC 4015]
MSDRFWPDAKASIILLPSGEQGEAVLDLASEWTRMGLLGPALWVLPEEVTGAKSGPPRIQALVLGIGRDLEVMRVPVDLFEALAREALAVVRLVKLRSAVPSREMDGEQDAIADRVREYVRKSMPMANPGTSVVDQAAELAHVTLICAPTEFQLQQRVDWASSEYGTVVVASPEDRSSPWSGDAFVRDDHRFVGFTLLHLASAAGLWSGVPTGSFELVRREESTQGSVWISRVFVNAVLTESLGRRTAAHVLAEAARPESLLVDPSVSSPPPGTAFIQDSQVTGYVDEMVRGALSLDSGTLLFHEPTFHDDPSKRRVGLWRQLGRFVSFSADKLARMPVWTWRWIASRSYRTATRALHSNEGSEVVGYAYDEVFDVRERILLAQAELIVDDEARARAEAGAPAGLSRIRTTPALWARMRELIFGSLDGSADLSDIGFAPIEEVVPIFGRVSDVLALPDQPWVPPRTLVPEAFPQRVDWYALALQDPREQLVDAVSAAAERRIEAQRALDEALVALQEAERAVPAETPAAATDVPPSDAPPISVDSAGVASPEKSSTNLHDAIVAPARSRVEAAAADVGSAADAVERYTESVNQFDAWAVTQDRSFVWKLLNRLAEERRHAEEHASALAEEIDAIETPQAGELISHRRRFHRVMLISWGIGLVFAALVVLGFVLVDQRAEADPAFDPQTWNRVLGWIAIIIAAALVVATVVALASYHVGWSRFQRKIDVQRQRLSELGKNSRLAREEAARLTSVHRQTVDWLVLLSRAIHRPWFVPATWTAREESNVVRDTMPFAVQVALVRDDDLAASARLRGVMTDSLVVKGWRHAAFASLVDEVAAERGGSFGLHALDDDLPHASNHTRKMLLASLDDEALLARVAGPRLEAVVRAAQRADTKSSRPPVQPVIDNPLSALIRPGGPSDSTGTAWDDFLLGSLAGRRDPMTPLSATVLTDIELGERHHERVESFLVLPARLASGLRYPEGTPIHVVPFDSERNSAVELSWRVDIAGPVPIRAIHLWDDSNIAKADVPPAADSHADSGI